MTFKKCLQKERTQCFLLKSIFEKKKKKKFIEKKKNNKISKDKKLKYIIHDKLVNFKVLQNEELIAKGCKDIIKILFGCTVKEETDKFQNINNKGTPAKVEKKRQKQMMTKTYK